MNFQNLQQKNGTLLAVNLRVTICTKIRQFLTKSIESGLCDYFDAYILVTGNIAVTRTIAAGGDDPLQRKQAFVAATQVAFKNCAVFKDCITEIDGTFVDYADFINTAAMPIYNLIEYSENYSDSSRSLWGFKRDDIVNNADVTNNDNAPSFKYKASLITDTEANRHHLNTNQILWAILAKLEQETMLKSLYH